MYVDTPSSTVQYSIVFRALGGALSNNYSVAPLFSGSHSLSILPRWVSEVLRRRLRQQSLRLSSEAENNSRQIALLTTLQFQLNHKRLVAQTIATSWSLSSIRRNVLARRYSVKKVSGAYPYVAVENLPQFDRWLTSAVVKPMWPFFAAGTFCSIAKTVTGRDVDGLWFNEKIMHG